MKKVLLFICLIGFIILPSYNTKADVGPKPSISVEINGMEGIEYTITLLGKSVSPPYRCDFSDEDCIKYNPIIDFTDDKGYQFAGRYWEEEGNTTISWNYYPPNPFKILIITENNTYYISEEIERYAFNAYYKIDMKEVLDEGNSNMIQITDIERDFNFGKEIPSFLLRVLLTIVIELLIALLFLYKKKKELLFILIVNVFTQIFLNLMLNLSDFKSGLYVAIYTYILLELAVFAIETICYGIKFKDKSIIRTFLYAFIANVSSFAFGFLIYVIFSI